jgi:hypothetical protein
MNASAVDRVKSNLCLRSRSPAAEILKPDGPLPGSPFLFAVAGQPLKSARRLRSQKSPAVWTLKSDDRLPGSPISFAVAARLLKSDAMVRPPSPADFGLKSKSSVPGSPFQFCGRRSMFEIHEPDATAKEPGRDDSEIRVMRAGLTFLFWEDKMKPKPDLEALRAAATTVLQNHDNKPAKALGKFVRAIEASTPLREALCFEYLSSIANTTEAASRAGRLLREIQPKSRRRGFRRPYRKPTSGQIEAERAVMASSASVYDRMIGDRKLGDIVWGELRDLHDKAVLASVEGIKLGVHEAEAAILFEKLAAHAVVTDHTTPIRDVVKPALLAEYVAEAKVEAPQRIFMAWQRAAEVINHKPPELLQ